MTHVLNDWAVPGSTRNGCRSTAALPAWSTIVAAGNLPTTTQTRAGFASGAAAAPVYVASIGTRAVVNLKCLLTDGDDVAGKAATWALALWQPTRQLRYNDAAPQGGLWTPLGTVTWSSTNGAIGPAFALQQLDPLDQNSNEVQSAAFADTCTIGQNFALRDNMQIHGEAAAGSVTLTIDPCEQGYLAIYVRNADAAGSNGAALSLPFYQVVRGGAV